MAEIDEIRARIKKNYEFERWPAPAAGLGRPVRRFAYAPSAISGYVHELRRALPEHGAWTDYYRSTTREGEHFAVTLSEYESPEAAREALVLRLADSMSLRLPRAEDKGIRVGEVAFAGHDVLQTGLYFVRENVLVDVSSTGPVDAAVEDLAVQVDRQLLARPRLR